MEVAADARSAAMLVPAVVDAAAPTDAAAVVPLPAAVGAPMAAAAEEEKVNINILWQIFNLNQSQSSSR